MPPPASFLTVSAFPYSRVVTVAEFNGGTFGGVANEVWFKYVSTGAAALGNYINSPVLMRTDTYETDALNPLQNVGAAYWVEIVTSQNYWIRIVKNAGGAIAANFTVNFDTASMAPVVTPGDYVINDDLNSRTLGIARGYAAAVLSPAGVLRGFKNGVPGGELGESLNSGVQLWHDRYQQHGSRLALFDADLNFLLALDTSPTLGATFPNILTDGTKFYVVNRANNKVHTVSSVGVVSAPIATLDAVPTASGVNAAGTILYFSTLSDVIRRWDLVNDVTLTDLYAPPELASNTGTIATTALNGHPGELLVFSDGTIVTYYQNVTLSKSVLLHLNAAGTLLHSYTYTWPTAIDHIAWAPDSPAYINIWFFLASDGSSGRMGHLNISTGALTSFDTDLFSGGVNITSGNPTKFGPSTSCTMVTAKRAEAMAAGTDPGADPNGDLGDGDPSHPDCCDKGTPSGDIGTNPDPIGILPAWLASCIGGGQPDTNVSLADGEAL